MAISISLNLRRVSFIRVNVNLTGGPFNQFEFSTNNGTNWIVAGSSIQSIFEISGLAHGTQYQIKFRARKTDNTYDTSNTLTVNTLSRVSSTDSNFNVTVEREDLHFYYFSMRNIDLQTFRISLQIGSTVFATRTATSAYSSELYSFILTKAEQEKIFESIATASSSNYTINIQTLYNGQPDGAVWTATGKITLSSYKVIPTFSNFTYADINSVTVALTGNNQKIVKGFSNVQASISTANKAVGILGATIKQYKLQIGNKSVTVNELSGALSLLINNADNSYISITAIDSRGFQTTIGKTAPFVEYFRQNVVSAKLVRENGVGSKVFFELHEKTWVGNFGAVQNRQGYVDVRFKKKTDSTWGAWIALNTKVIADTSGNIRNKTDGTNFIPTTSNGSTPYVFDNVEYDFEFGGVDSLAGAYNFAAKLSSGILGTALVQMGNGKYALGIGKLPDLNALPNGGIDIDGALQYSGVNDLPSGDGNSIEYWKTLKNSKYFCRPNVLAGQPDGYGFVIVDANNNDTSVLFYTQPEGLVYRKSMNSSQISNWIPVNAIYNSGSNSNGAWIKFTDGTMICRNKIIGTYSGAASSGVYYAGQGFTFPQAFISADDLLVIPFVTQQPGVYFASMGNKDTLTVSQMQMRVLCLTSFSNTSLTVGYIAIGRWK